MRVKVKEFDGSFQPGTFLGLLAPNSCDQCGSDTPLAVVRLDDNPHGLYLTEANPSRVIPVNAPAADAATLRKIAEEVVEDLGFAQPGQEAFVNVVYRALARVALAPEVLPSA